MSQAVRILTLSCMFLGVLLPPQASAQEDGAPLRIGLGYTGTAYRGDLTTESTALWRAEPGANFSVDLNNQKRIRPQLNIGFGRFTEQADEPLPVPPEGITPNEFVRTSFFYADLRFQYRILLGKKVNPYVSAGAGLFSFQPRDAAGNFLGENIFSRLPEEEYLTLIGSFPLSVGAEIPINNSIGLGLEYTYRVTGSDYLDNISQLGTASGNDQLHTAQIKLFLTLGQKVQGPPAEAFEIPAEPAVPEIQPEVEEPVEEVPVFYRHKDGKLRRR